MRATSWVIAAAVIGLASPAAGHPSGCAGCNRGQAAGPTASWALDAEACATPPGYTLAPGCCEESRHCCDNAWAGYCEHRAKVEAFWARVGTAKPYCRPAGCRPTSMAPCAEHPAKAVQPTPAVPPDTVAPPPAPATEAPLPPPPKVSRLPPLEKAVSKAASPPLR
jgi:hypothetical protein